MGKKEEQLGMAVGTAANRLRKMVLFYLLGQLGLTECSRCFKEIKSIRELSMEHLEPWLDSEDPIGLYFDIENIAFSHLSCNSSAHRTRKAEHGTISRYEGHNCRCELCKEAKALYRKHRYDKGAGRSA